MSVTFYNTKDPHISGLSAPEDSRIINTDIVPGESQPLLKNSRRLVKANISSKFSQIKHISVSLVILHMRSPLMSNLKGINREKERDGHQST